MMRERQSGIYILAHKKVKPYSGCPNSLEKNWIKLTKVGVLWEQICPTEGQGQHSKSGVYCLKHVWEN